jgi:hypothetical protein
VIRALLVVGYPVGHNARDVGEATFIAAFTDSDGNPIGLAPAL